MPALAPWTLIRSSPAPAFTRNVVPVAELRISTSSSSSPRLTVVVPFRSFSVTLSKPTPVSIVVKFALELVARLIKSLPRPVVTCRLLKFSNSVITRAGGAIPVSARFLNRATPPAAAPTPAELPTRTLVPSALTARELGDSRPNTPPTLFRTVCTYSKAPVVKFRSKTAIASLLSPVASRYSRPPPDMSARSLAPTKPRTPNAPSRAVATGRVSRSPVTELRRKTVTLLSVDEVT